MTDYIPKRDEFFNAINALTGRQPIGCPCQAKSISSARVEAVDAAGNVREFYRNIWRFEKAE